jgi:hypothetical protein
MQHFYSPKVLFVLAACCFGRLLWDIAPYTPRFIEIIIEFLPEIVINQGE